MVPAESAHDTVAALGDIGALHFKDLNADKGAFQRPHAIMVCRFFLRGWAFWLMTRVRGRLQHADGC